MKELLLLLDSMPVPLSHSKNLERRSAKPATQSVGHRKLYSVQLNNDASNPFCLPRDALSCAKNLKDGLPLPSARQSLWRGGYRCHELQLTHHCNPYEE